MTRGRRARSHGRRRRARRAPPPSSRPSDALLRCPSYGFSGGVGDLALVVEGRLVGGAGAGDEQLDRGREARQLDLADRIEVEVTGGSDRVGDGGGDQDLAPER